MVKTAVCVRKPGPTEVVAIKKATLRMALFFQDADDEVTVEVFSVVAGVVILFPKIVVSLFIKIEKQLIEIS